jgi:ribonuclease
VQSQRHFRPAWISWLLVAVVAVVSIFGLAAVIRPARASVYGSCSISRCSDARSANSTWASKGYPASRGWYSWPGGLCDYAGGRYYNYEGELPSGDIYYEYDVYPRSCGASRDAYRIVVDSYTGRVWFSPNHYTDFYQL